MNFITDRIEENMSANPSYIASTVSVREASDFMHEMGFRHLPVIDQERLVGILSERDLRQAVLLADSVPLSVGDVMISEPYCVRAGTRLSEVVSELADRKIGSAIVVDDDDVLIGIFTTTDALHILNNILRSYPQSHAYHHGVEEFLGRPKYNS